MLFQRTIIMLPTSFTTVGCVTCCSVLSKNVIFVPNFCIRAASSKRFVSRGNKQGNVINGSFVAVSVFAPSRFHSTEISRDNILRSTTKLPPIPEGNLAEHICQLGEEDGNQIAMIQADDGREFTFSEISNLSRKVARNLFKRGIRKGDVVGITTGIRWEFSVFTLGALLCGATVTSFNPLQKTGEIKRALDICLPKIVVASESSVEAVLEASKQCSFVEDIFSIDPYLGSKNFETLLEDPGEVNFERPVIDSRKAIALLPFSSGTTGFPKAVVLTHHSLLSGMTIAADKNIFNVDSKTVNSGMMPLYHIYGMIVMLLSLFHRSKIVLFPTFQPQSFLKTMEKYKVTHLYTVPPVAVFLVKSDLVLKYDLSSIKEIVSAASMMSEDTQRDLIKRLNLENVRQAYGMTETTACATVNSPRLNKVGSVGPLLPGFEAKVVDISTGDALAAFTNGELLLRGPLVCGGYYRDQAATEETIDSDGWLHTGDVGHYDNDGFFYIVDRVKELIKYKSNQVAPSELESILLTHPAVIDVGVIGIPDEEAGELPRAYVVKRPNTNVNETELQNFLAELVAPYKKLRGGVVFVESIPKNPTGKILRRLLKEEALKELEQEELTKKAL